MDSSANPFLYHAGFYNTNAYLASGLPYLTGSVLLSSSFATNNSEIRVRFDKVTRSITVINTSNVAILASFLSITSSNVSGGHHYTTLQNNKDNITYNMRVREIYISLANGSANGSFELVAEQTTIDQHEALTLTGSGISV